MLYWIRGVCPYTCQEFASSLSKQKCKRFNPERDMLMIHMFPSLAPPNGGSKVNLNQGWISMENIIARPLLRWYLAYFLRLRAVLRVLGHEQSMGHCCTRTVAVPSSFHPAPFSLRSSTWKQEVCILLVDVLRLLKILNVLRSGKREIVVLARYKVWKVNQRILSLPALAISSIRTSLCSEIIPKLHLQRTLTVLLKTYS